MHPASLLRIDPLTGCLNLLAFTEWLGAYFGQEEMAPITVLSIDVNRFSEVNLERGRDQGDAVLRWVGIVLREVSHMPVYRTGGDEFTVVIYTQNLPDMPPELHLTTGSWMHGKPVSAATLIFDRLSQDAVQIGLENPPASLASIHFSMHPRVQADEALLMIGAAILQTKQRFARGFHEFEAADLLPEVESSASRWFAGHMIENIVLLGRKLDETEHLAYTDPVTGLPNQRAAARTLESSLMDASSQGASLAVLLMDGDDLKAYNEISYAAGDDMIRRLAEILQSNLRPGDFICRWRVGDEFLVVLPGTQLSQALLVGERLVEAVRIGSRDWEIPISISAGLAMYPQNGLTSEALLEAAERSNMQAKTQGKDRIILADQEGAIDA